MCGCSPESGQCLFVCVIAVQNQVSVCVCACMHLCMHVFVCVCSPESGQCMCVCLRVVAFLNQVSVCVCLRVVAFLNQVSRAANHYVLPEVCYAQGHCTTLLR